MDCDVAPTDDRVARLHEPELSFADYRGKPVALRGDGEAQRSPIAVGRPYSEANPYRRASNTLSSGLQIREKFRFVQDTNCARTPARMFHQLVSALSFPRTRESSDSRTCILQGAKALDSRVRGNDEPDGHSSAEKQCNQVCSVDAKQRAKESPPYAQIFPRQPQRIRPSVHAGSVRLRTLACGRYLAAAIGSTSASDRYAKRRFVVPPTRRWIAAGPQPHALPAEEAATARSSRAPAPDRRSVLRVPPGRPKGERGSTADRRSVAAARWQDRQRRPGKAATRTRPTTQS